MALVRKGILVGLCLLAAVILLFGPRAGSDLPPGRVVIQYWEKWNGPEADVMRDIVKDFNRTIGREKGIFVEYLSISRIDQKTLVSTAAGVPPDIAGLWDTQLAQFAAMDALEPLDDLAAEFGITPKQSLAGLLMFLSDVHSLGLKATQGMYLTTGFYWDRNDETRAWSKRFFAKRNRMPTMVHAGDYSAVTHYLKAVKAVGTDDTNAVMARMKATPINDFFARNGKIRVDGRMVHDMYLAQVKKPGESKYPWDYYFIRQVIPADQAFMPLSKSKCPLVKK